MKLQYFCEFCGKAFENKEECEKHENAHRVALEEKKKKDAEKSIRLDEIKNKVDEYKKVGEEIEALASKYHNDYNDVVVLDTNKDFYSFWPDFFFSTDSKRIKSFMDSFLA